MKTALVLAGLSLALPVLADEFNDATNGNYNANTTWGVAANPANGLADTVIIDSQTVTLTGANQLSNDTVKIYSNGTLTFNDTHAPSNFLRGALIELHGGTIRTRHVNANIQVGGEIAVYSNSNWIVWNFADAQNGRSPLVSPLLEFAVAGQTLTFRKENNTTTVAWYRFDELRMSQSGTIALGGANSSLSFQVGSVGLTGNGTLSFVSTNIANFFFQSLPASPNYTGQLVLRDGGRLIQGSALPTLGTGGSYAIEAGGMLMMREQNLVLGSSPIYLRGGVLYHKLNSSLANLGGNFIVESGDSILHLDAHNDARQCTAGYDQLTFAGGNLTVRGDAGEYDTYLIGPTSVGGNNSMAAQFRFLTVNQSGTLTIAANGSYAGAPSRIGANASGTGTNVFIVGQTLTKAGAGALGVAGVQSTRLRGSADLLAGTSFTLLDHTEGTTDYDASPSLDTAGGLWSYGSVVDNTDLTVTFEAAQHKGSLGVGQSLSFAADDSGYITFNGLTLGGGYTLYLDLQNNNAAAVIAEMLKNNAWLAVDSNDLPAGYEVRVLFEAPLSGAAQFAWDNTAVRLGDNLQGVQLIPEPSALVLVGIGLLGCLALGYRRS